MNYLIGNDKEVDKGFIYVASYSYAYYEFALYSCTTLKDYYPDAHVTLFTHKNFVDERAKIFDNVITDIPVHYRAKMWCMARTPYKKTIYIDADSMIMHKDIRTMHNFLDNHDMFFCPVTTYTVGNIKVAYIDKNMTIKPEYHGAICGYNKSDLTLDFHQTWFDEYVKQRTEPWQYGEKHYPDWRVFDMFTLWRITTNTYGGFDRFQNLKIHVIPLRYIITAQHTEEDKKRVRPVIHQIDRTTYRHIEVVQKRIEEKAKNAIYSFKECEAFKAPNQYN